MIFRYTRTLSAWTKNDAQMRLDKFSEKQIVQQTNLQFIKNIAL